MYNPNKAAKYWGSRIKNYDLKSAVLSLSFPQYLNDAYESWEFQSLKSNIGNVKNKKIIDIACGGGRISIPLSKMGAKITGVDISKDMLNYAMKNARKNSCSSNIHLINANAWETGLPTSSFDKVLLLGILEHLPDAQKKLTLQEANRLVKNKGTIYIVINNKNSFFLNLVKKWKKPTQQKSGYYSSLMEPKNVLSYLKSLNLEVKKIRSNLNYSILLHALKTIDSAKISIADTRKIYELFEYFINLDIHSNMKNDNLQYSSLESRFADQYFLMVKKI